MRVIGLLGVLGACAGAEETLGAGGVASGPADPLAPRRLADCREEQATGNYGAVTFASDHTLVSGATVGNNASQYTYVFSRNADGACVVEPTGDVLRDSRPVRDGRRVVAVAAGPDGQDPELLLLDPAAPRAVLARVPMPADAAGGLKRATVLTNAISTRAPDGAIETDLVLFVGEERHGPGHQVELRQLATLSDSTLTARGVLAGTGSTNLMVTDAILGSVTTSGPIGCYHLVHAWPEGVLIASDHWHQVSGPPAAARSRRSMEAAARGHVERGPQMSAGGAWR